MEKQWHSCLSLLTPAQRPLAAAGCVSELQSRRFRCLTTKGSFYSFDHLGLPRAREKWKKLRQIHLSKRSYRSLAVKWLPS